MISSPVLIHSVFGTVTGLQSKKLRERATKMIESAVKNEKIDIVPSRMPRRYSE